MSMTREEAIKRIQHHMVVHHIGEPPHIYIKEALDMAIDALREQEENRWIPVTERMPNICEPVLICVDLMGGKAVRASDRYGKSGMLWSGVPSNIKVTHWMPLPEPPKEEHHG